MSVKQLDAAKALAKLSKCRHKHGAILYKRGRVIAAGTNYARGDPRFGCWAVCSAHAEEVVLAQAGSWAHGATLYLARVNAHGLPLPSAPCKRCAGVLSRAGVAKVVNT